MTVEPLRHLRCASIPGMLLLMVGSCQFLDATPYAFAQNLLTNFRVISPFGSIADVSGSRSNINTAQYGNLSDTNSDPVFLPNGSDAEQATAGPGLFPDENNFSPFQGQGVLNGARGDSLTLIGNPFVGAGGTGAPVVFNVSEAEVMDDGSGLAASSSGRNTANASFSFSLLTPTAITFAFDNIIYLRAATSQAGESANAAVANSFDITRNDGTQMFVFTPTTCGDGNLQGSVGSTGGVPSEITMIATCSSAGTSQLLDAGLYSVSLRTTSQVNVQAAITETPEPATMVVSGAGLIALTLVTKFRKNKKAEVA